MTGSSRHDDNSFFAHYLYIAVTFNREVTFCPFLFCIDYSEICGLILMKFREGTGLQTRNIQLGMASAASRNFKKFFAETMLFNA